MTAPVTKIFLSSSNLGTAGYRLLASAPSDFSSMVTGVSLAPWISGISDLNGDGIGEVITGSAYDDDKDIDAGRVFVTFDATPVTLGDSLAEIVIDGVNAGDHAGSSVGSVVDLNADGKAEILVGASGMDDGAAIDAGAAFVIWGKSTAGGIDLGDPFAGDGNGYVMKGEAAGDAAGSAMTSISDLNANGKAEIIVGATGNDAGGADAGAAYVVFGKSSGSIVNLSSVAAGSGGYKIIGENAGDHIGAALATLADVNGDGKEEILLGAADSEAGGAGSGAAYVVFGKSSTASVDLSNVAAGVGGYRITGDVGDRAGDAVSGLGDINGDGVADFWDPSRPTP